MLSIIRILCSMIYLFVICSCSRPDSDSNFQTFESKKSSKIVALDLNGVCAANDGVLKCFQNYGIPPHPKLTSTKGIESSFAGFYSCAYDEQGSYCMTSDRVFRREVPGLKSMAAGYDHRCYLSDESGVFCEGYNGYGQLNPPILKKPIEVSAGVNFSCALDKEDGIKCWGNKESTNVPLISNPRQLVSGHSTSCVKGDDGVRCWGRDADKCNALTDSRENIKSVFFWYGSECCVLTTENRIECVSHQKELAKLGNQADPAANLKVYKTTVYEETSDGFNIVTPSKSLFDIPHFSNSKNLQQLVTSETHSCVLDGENVTCWGRNDDGQLNTEGLRSASKIAVSAYNTCAIIQEKIKCVGSHNTAGISPPQNFLASYIVGWQNHFCAGNQGEVRCWGRDQVDAISGLTSPKAVIIGGGGSGGTMRVCVLDDSYVKCRYTTGSVDTRKFRNPVAISGGNQAYCVLTNDGLLSCPESPYNLPKFSNLKIAAGGLAHACAIDDQGVQCWGGNAYNQLNIPRLINPRLLATGPFHTCAVDDFGVHCWGGAYGYKF